MKPDEIFKDLTTIRNLKWQDTDEFEGLKLLEHPEVRRRAGDKDGGVRVRALKEVLVDAKKVAQKREQQEKVEKGRSVASAVGILLRLNGRGEKKSTGALRDEIGATWTGKRGNGVTGDSWRQKYEDEVLRIFAGDIQVTLAEPAKGGALAPLPGVSLLGARERQLLAYLRKREEERLEGIPREGKLQIRDDEEMLEILLRVNKMAKKSLRAVDRTPIGYWTETESAAREYLDQQLELVKKKSLSLERIHVVAPSTLKRSKDCERLVEFVHRHEEVSASVLLCPKRVISAMRPQFFLEDRGMLLVDSEKDPLAVTGKLKEGEIGSAFLFTRQQAEVENCRRQYKNLRERILAGRHDKQVREELGLPVSDD